ncbi:protein of unknown function [Gracilibacillus ureilyticus]|uniref:DUF4179 domain-containing protein n=1 Tax=Gracilibacillus ureilyticus TaxID=531814 RepID=A0A1H9W0X2_9BACI|nr:DUF4179 domain-containing protein [Gracilibacillus ureilyticus]SES27600.1 protein of unknown function [Gracilibacillus ureilyticus]
MNNLSTIFKNQIKKDDLQIPDKEKMWNEIQLKQQNNGRTGKKLKVAIPAFIFAIVISSTPVLAAYSTDIIDWMYKINRPGVISSLENGFGQEVNQSSQNETGTLTVHNIVADQNGTTINFSIDKETSQVISAAQFDEAMLISEDGTESILQATAVYDDNADKIVGFFHTEEEMKADQTITLSVSGLHEYGTEQISLNNSDISQNGTTPIDHDGIDEIEYINSEYHNGIYQLDYLIELNDSNKIDYANLTFHLDGEPIESSTVVYKKPEPNVMKVGNSLQIPEDKVNDLEISLEYQDTIAFSPANWSLSFEYNHNLAKKSTFVMDVDEEVELGNRVLQFEELAVSPSEVKLYFDEERLDSNESVFNYETIELQIGDQRLTGYFAEENYLTFETTNILKDIETQPISLQLQGAKVSYEGTKNDKIQLENISNQSQKVKTEIQGYPVEFTYYTKGKNLIIESESEDTQFGGITQSVIYRNGDRIFAEARSNDGLNSSNKQVETFKNISDQDTLLHIFLYTTYEERQKVVKFN